MYISSFFSVPFLDDGIYYLINTNSLYLKYWIKYYNIIIYIYINLNFNYNLYYIINI